MNIQYVEVIDIKHLKYICVCIIYKRFSIEDKAIENRIVCDRDIFAEYRKLLQIKSWTYINRLVISTLS